jgi:hypothetical protein
MKLKENFVENQTRIMQTVSQVLKMSMFPRNLKLPSRGVSNGAFAYVSVS